MQHQYMFLQIRMCLVVHLSCISAIIRSIISGQNPYKHDRSISFFVRLFTNRPDGTGKEKLWVKGLLV